MTATVEAPAKRKYIHRSPQEKYERSAEMFEKEKGVNTIRPLKMAAKRIIDAIEKKAKIS